MEFTYTHAPLCEWHDQVTPQVTRRGEKGSEVGAAVAEFDMVICYVN